MGYAAENLGDITIKGSTRQTCRIENAASASAAASPPDQLGRTEIVSETLRIWPAAEDGKAGPLGRSAAGQGDGSEGRRWTRSSACRGWRRFMTPLTAIAAIWRSIWPSLRN